MKRFSAFLLGAAAALCMLSTAAGQPPAASGDSLSAAGDFAAAGQAYEAALKAAPADARALAGLARVRLYENRNDEAIALAQKALDAQPNLPPARQVLGVARQRKAAFGGDLYEIAQSPPEVTVPFAITDPLPVVQVALGGRQAWFLIDTGAPDIMVAPELAKELGLAVQDAGQGVFAGGLRAAVQRTIVPEVQIGGLKIANVPAGVRAGGLPIPGYKIEGVVGTGLLMHFLSTLDYCQGRLVMRPRSASAAFEQAAAKGGANIVPMWLASDHFIMARAHLQHGAEGTFLIDTGLAGGGVTAPKATLDEAGVVVDLSKGRAGVGGGGPVTYYPFSAGATLGSLTVENVPGVYIPGADALGGLPFKTSGTISHAFFRHSRLTFDFDAMKLVTEQCVS
jgi:tetratricopeptide (TPR) repeat protein